MKTNKILTFTLLLFCLSYPLYLTGQTNLSQTNDWSELPFVIVRPNGEVVVAWTEGDFNGSGVIWYRIYTEQNGWSDAKIAATAENRSASFPQMAIDSEGDIHMAYMDGNSSANREIYYRKYSNGQWSAGEQVYLSSGVNSSWPRIDVEGNKIYVLWCHNYTRPGAAEHDLDIVLMEKDDNGTWPSQYQNVSKLSKSVSVHPFFQVHNGNAFAAWMDDNHRAGKWNIYYNERTGGSWGKSVHLDPGFNQYTPAMAVDKNGNIHVIYSNKTNPVWYMQKNSSGWTVPVDISTARTTVASMLFMVCKHDHLHAVFRQKEGEGDYIYYAKGTIDGVWEAPQKVSSGGEGEYPGIDVDARGTAHIVYSDMAASGYRDIFHATVDTGTGYPVASFTASPTQGDPPLQVNFDASESYAPLGNIVSYDWDFGDGNTGSGVTVSHTYQNNGVYTAELTVTDDNSLSASTSEKIYVGTPEIYLTPSSLYFGATSGSTGLYSGATSGSLKTSTQYSLIKNNSVRPLAKTSTQYFLIKNNGAGTLAWSIQDDANWLSCSPTSGSGDSIVTVSVDPTGLAAGTYSGTITVTDPNATNSPQSVSVTFTVYATGADSTPIGYLDTPTHGSTVSGAIPVTGWALDDIEVTKVEIKRSSDPTDSPAAIGKDGLVYIGDAVFVIGARPDIEAAYPGYPLNYQAGWGYQMLTNFLPNQGNGTFIIYAFAYDGSNHKLKLGEKTIYCDNENRIKPFGTIDTPLPGGTISGTSYVNWGWGLTPQPKEIPRDGSTIEVFIDSVPRGQPVYNLFRQDIYDLFPSYNNSDGAVGYYYLDTTQYPNGIHTISWLVEDDDGELDGVGSRYFGILNFSGTVTTESGMEIGQYRKDTTGRLRIDIEGEKEIEIEELGRIELKLKGEGGNRYIGWGMNRTKSLPIGSTLDKEKGLFYWMPGPGFLRRHILHFAVTDGIYMSRPVRVTVNIVPKRYDRIREKRKRKK